jgi:hypothetical protein
VIHCNECDGREDVSHVVVTMERRTPITDMPGLAKEDGITIEGDLCTTCLQVVIQAVSEEAGFGIGPLERNAAGSHT